MTLQIALDYLNAPLILPAWAIGLMMGALLFNAAMLARAQIVTDWEVLVRYGTAIRTAAKRGYESLLSFLCAPIVLTLDRWTIGICIAVLVGGIGTATYGSIWYELRSIAPAAPIATACRSPSEQT